MYVTPSVEQVLRRQVDFRQRLLLGQARERRDRLGLDRSSSRTRSTFVVIAPSSAELDALALDLPRFT